MSSCEKPGLDVRWKEIDDGDGSFDMENGSTTFERVILSIHGMKCTCCDTSIAKACRQVKSIRNHYVNTVLARVEFELDTSRVPIHEAIASLQRATTYTFKRVMPSQGQMLEVLTHNPGHLLHQAGKPHGVTRIECAAKKFWSPSMLFNAGSSAILPPNSLPRSSENYTCSASSTMLHQHIVRIHYDSNEIGARDVFEYYRHFAPLRSLQLAPLPDDPRLATGNKELKRAFATFLLASLFTIPVLVFAWATSLRHQMMYAHVSLGLASIVQIIAMKEFVWEALKLAIHSALFGMDFLISLSTSTAYVFSVVTYVFQLHHRPLDTDSFFETSTLLVTLILLGRFVGELARLKAARAVSFRSLQASEALLVVRGQLRAESHKIDARLLQYGDQFQVPPHTRIVTDGEVIHGRSEVDESTMTGESLPVAKGLGHHVYAGTTNGSGQLTIALTALPHENTLSKVATMVDNAELTKPKVQAVADRIARRFVPTIIFVGTMVFMIWLLVGKRLQGMSWGAAVVQAVTYTIATFVVSCPCAIVLAVPMAVLIASGISARYGIILRDPQKIEVACNVTDIVFDKTGTITNGNLSVIEVEHYGNESEYTYNVLLGLLQNERHPVAIAVVDWCKAHVKLREPEAMIDVRSIPGNGVTGLHASTKEVVHAGNPLWVGAKVLESPYTELCITISGILRATFRLHDSPRLGASIVVKHLVDRGLKVHMISGDAAGAVNEVAHAVNIPKAQTSHRLTPRDKKDYITKLQKKGAVVIFCGDGANDAVALRQADVGVHLNHGTDVAKSASDVVLMTSNLAGIPILLDISKAAYHRIMFNFGWSALYNVVAILMAAGAFVKVRIAPEWAGLGEVVSVLPVVFIAFQLRWKDYGSAFRGIQYQENESMRPERIAKSESCR